MAGEFFEITVQGFATNHSTLLRTRRTEKRVYDHRRDRTNLRERTFASYVIEISPNYAKHTVRRASPVAQRTTSSAFECVGADVTWVVLAIWESRWNPTALISFIGYRFGFRMPVHRGRFMQIRLNFRLQCVSGLRIRIFISASKPKPSSIVSWSRTIYFYRSQKERNILKIYSNLLTTYSNFFSFWINTL